MAKTWKNKPSGTIKMKGSKKQSYNLSNGTIHHAPRGQGKISTGSGCVVLIAAFGASSALVIGAIVEVVRLAS